MVSGGNAFAYALKGSNASVATEYYQSFLINQFCTMHLSFNGDSNELYVD